MLFFFFAGVIFAANTATRTLPGTYIPGGTIDVTVNVLTDMLDMPTGVVVLESLPAGWSIISATPGWNKYTVETNTYRWLFYSQSGLWPFSITYTVSVPADASGTNTFSGVIRIRGFDDITIGGDTSIGQASGGGAGDINSDGGVDISDVILCLRMAVGLEIVLQSVAYPFPYNDTLKGLADMNGDGIIDISDVILTLRKSVGLPI